MTRSSSCADIPFQSHCEHHMAPIIGKAHIAYLPRDHVVGISKLARVLNAFARRLPGTGAPNRGSWRTVSGQT